MDGVLTSQRVHVAHNSKSAMWDRFDPVAVDFFNKLHDTYDDVSVVLSSSWRQLVNDESSAVPHWVEATFRCSGFRGKFATPWKTKDLQEKSALYHRSYEVLDYLEQAQPEDYLVFDDTDYNFNSLLPKKRFVHTSLIDGLLSKHMAHTLSLTGNWGKNRWVN